MKNAILILLSLLISTTIFASDSFLYGKLIETMNESTGEYSWSIRLAGVNERDKTYRLINTRSLDLKECKAAKLKGSAINRVEAHVTEFVYCKEEFQACDFLSNTEKYRVIAKCEVITESIRHYGNIRSATACLYKYKDKNNEDKNYHFFSQYETQQGDGSYILESKLFTMADNKVSESRGNFKLYKFEKDSTYPWDITLRKTYLNYKKKSKKLNWHSKYRNTTRGGMGWWVGFKYKFTCE